MLKPSLFVVLLLAGTVVAQQQTPQPQKPQVRLNYLNVCTPSDEEQKQIVSALARLPERPQFAPDFEVTRGRTTMTDNSLFAAGQGAQMSNEAPAVSRYVRVRKDFPERSPFTQVQYSFSVAENRAVETLTFLLRDAADLKQVTISDTVTVGEDPGAVVRTDTPADRIRLERFGKASLAIARCEETDQSRYEPLFQNATKYLSSYRALLGVRDTVPAELKRVPSQTAEKRTSKKNKTAGAKLAPERKP